MASKAAVHDPGCVRSPDASWHRATSHFLAFALALLGFALQTTVLAFPSAPYVPLVDGASWTATLNGVGGYTVTIVPGVVFVNGVQTKRLVRSWDSASSYYSNDAAGVRLHREAYPSLFVPGCGNVSATVTFSPPVLYAPADVAIGATYSSAGTAFVEVSGCATGTGTAGYSATSSIIGTEKVTVPLGTFEALRVVFSVNASLNGELLSSETETLWLAPQVGSVREVDSTDTYALVATNLVRTQPDAFSFNAVPSAPLGSQVVSNAIIVTGTTAPAPISISGGQYSVNDGPFVSAAGSVGNGQRVAVRVTTPNVNNSSATATLTIGGMSASFTVNSPFQADTTPDALGFTTQRTVPSGTAVTSNAITVTGVNVSVPITITGGSYSVNGGAFTTGSSTVGSGDSVVVRVTSPSTENTQACAVLTVGGVQAPFCVSTGPLGIDLRQVFQLLLGD